MKSIINFIFVLGITIILFQNRSFSSKPFYQSDKNMEFNIEYRNDTLRTGINHNTTRSNYGNRSKVNSDIGVNEPGVNRIHHQAGFKAGAELADRVNKKAMTNKNNSFDVILKNGGSSLAMFENYGYTYLNNNGLLIVHDYPIRIVVQLNGHNSPDGEWSLIRQNDQRLRKGQGQVSDILKLKQSSIGKNTYLLEAEKLPPGEYILVWNSVKNRTVDLPETGSEVGFCYQYLPYVEYKLELMEINRNDNLCASPGTIASTGNIFVEVVPAESYYRLKNNKNTSSQVKK